LSFPDHRSLKLCHCPQQGQQEVGHRRVFTCEDQILFNELDVDTFLREVEDDSPQAYTITGGDLLKDDTVSLSNG
jgi:hypothetical protein